ncbi:MAG: outer membrane protein assembly factor BamB family protein [Planctomycetota bacterium]|jgi:outer membrane protein assembly factor BamB
MINTISYKKNVKGFQIDKLGRCYFILIAFCLSSVIFAGDWVQWRGSLQNGTSDETGLPSTWSQEGENLLWRIPVGCRSTPLIYNDRVFMISRVGEGPMQQERVVALDLDTGKTIWEHRFNVFLTDIVFHRLGWANLAIDPETGYIYAHGVQGLMFCYDQEGKIIWERSLTEELGRISGYGGRTHSPVIEGDQVVISSLTSSWGEHGPGAHRFFGMDKRTGEILWISAAGEKPLDTTYSVPVLTTMDGMRVMFTGLADGSIAALKTSTGETIWRFPLSARGIMSSVIYDDGRIYAVHGDTNVNSNIMGRLVCLDARTGKEIWQVDALAGQYSSPVLHDGLLYVANNAANLHCVDAKTGEVLWVYNYGNEAKGSPVYADGKLYVGDVPGAWRILEVNRSGCQQLNEQTFTEPSGAPDEVYASAAVGQGRVILSTLNQTFCISTKKQTYRTANKPMVLGSSGPMQAGNTVRIQIEPAETFLAPGETVKFRAKGFDNRGNSTGLVKAEFTVKDLEGTLAPDGTFTAKGKRIQAGHITATEGILKSSARVRIVPPLPYEENFDQCQIGLPPAGWITSKLKSQVSEYEGQKVLRKLAERPSPPFARLRGYIMPPIPAGYTIQSDILGESKKNRFLPDMGLINSRYLLILTGTSERTRKLRLVAWSPVPRLMREIEFPWEPDTWYTAKLSYDKTDNQGIVKAKVWQRGTPEPDDWTLTMQDLSPHLGGSPGL